MRIAAVCCTWCRPERLSFVVRCFERQDHPDREMVILDDAGQYESQSGDNWRLVSTKQRFPTLGEKRNAAFSLVSADVEGIAVFDDDDLYLPWAVSAIAAGLQVADWTRPSLVLGLSDEGRLVPAPSCGIYHGAWGFRRGPFERVGGYPHMNNGEDQGLASRLDTAGAICSDPIALGHAPYYIYWWGGDWHLSGFAVDGYERLGRLDRPHVGRLTPRDPPVVDLLNPRIDGWTRV
jgi:hypothetical protein